MEPLDNQQNQQPQESVADQVIRETNVRESAIRSIITAIQSVLAQARQEQWRIHDENIPGQLERLQRVCSMVCESLDIPDVRVEHDPNLPGFILGTYNPESDVITVGIRSSGHGLSVVTTLRMLAFHAMKHLAIQSSKENAVRISLVPYFAVWPMKRNRTDIFDKELLSAFN